MSIIASHIPLHCRYLGYLARNAHTPPSPRPALTPSDLDNASTQSFVMPQLTYSLRPSHALDFWSPSSITLSPPPTLPYPLARPRYLTPPYSALCYDPPTLWRASNLIVASDRTQNAPYPRVYYLYHHCFLRVLAYRHWVSGSLVVSGSPPLG